MRIISKEKDFYDFQFPYDETDDIVYVRTPKCYYTNGKAGSNIPEGVKELISTKGFAWPYTFNDFGWGNQKYLYSLIIESVVIGIYPYMYSVHFLILKDNRIKTPVKNAKYINVSIDTLTELTNSEIIDLYIKNNPNIDVNKKDIYCSSHYNPSGISSWYLNNYKLDREFIVYNEDIFRTLKSPIFAKFFGETQYRGYNYMRFMFSSVYKEVDPYLPGTLFFVDFSFNKMKNAGLDLMKYIYNELYKRDFYSDLENFQWAIKQEPESIPDNNTKIINAGFDLKTSFRNM